MDAYLNLMQVAAQEVGLAIIASLNWLLFDESNQAYYGRIIYAVALVLAIVWALLFRRSSNPDGPLRSLPVRIVKRGLVMLMVAICVHLQVMTIMKERRFQLMEDTIYLPDMRTVRLVALGYDRVLADYLFLRSIQAYGGGWQFSAGGGRSKLFEHYFNVITDLDPSFTKAYTFGNMLIGELMHSPAPAMGLLAKGIYMNPENYRVAYEAGFFGVDRLGDYQRGAHYMRWAAWAPDVPNWVQRQIYFFRIRGGDYEWGIERYLRMLVQSRRDANRVELNIARQRLLATLDEWGESIIIKGLDAYKAEKGHFPPNLAVLVESGHLGEWRILDTAFLLNADPESGDSYFDQIPSSMPINGQIDLAMKLMESGFRRHPLPPTSDRRGWFYTPQGMGESYVLRRLSEELQNAESAMYVKREYVRAATRLLTLPPPTIEKLFEQTQMVDSTNIAPDPEGTFIFYNPATSSVGYASALAE